MMKISLVEQLDSNTDSDSEQKENKCEREESKMEEEGMTHFEENVDEAVKKMTRLSVDEGLDKLTSRTRRLSKPKTDTFVRYAIKRKCNKASVLSKQPTRTGSNKV